MDFKGLSKVGTAAAPQQPTTSKTPVKDALHAGVRTIAKPNARPAVTTVSSKRTQRVADSKDYTVEELMNMERKERRAALGRMSDSARAKVLEEFKKVKDENNAQSYFQELADHITSQIIEMFGQEENLKKDMESDYLTEDMKSAINRVITLEPIEKDEIGEVFGPLKAKFAQYSIPNPPFALLQDSAQELLNAEKNGEHIQDGIEVPDFDAIDTDKNGVISLQEWKDAGLGEDIFIKIDTNEDGNISREEFDAFYKEEKIKDAGDAKKAIEHNLSDDDKVPEFDKIDTNQDGKISRSEWEDAGLDPDIFTVIDEDTDGEIDRESFDRFYNESLDGGDGAGEGEGDQGDGAGEGEGDGAGEGEGDPNKPEGIKKLEEVTKVVNAIEEYFQNGDISVFSDLEVSDALKPLVDAFDEDGKFKISEEEYKKILEDVEEDLKEKGLSVPDSFKFNNFSFRAVPKIPDSVSYSAPKMTRDEYKSLFVADQLKATMKLAAVLPQERVIPFRDSAIVDGILKLENGKQSQTWITDAVEVPEGMTAEWVKDNCIASSNFVKAAQMLGYASVLDDRFYKKSIQDSGFVCDPCTPEECIAEQSCCVPSEFYDKCLDLDASTPIVIILVPDSQEVENAVIDVPCEGAACPLEGMKCCALQA